MFTKAIEKAQKFIRPLIVCRRHHDGSVAADGATITIVNDQGWFISSARAFEVIPVSRMHMKEAAEFTAKLAKLKSDTSKEAKKELKRIRPNLKWITHSSVWTGQDEQKVTDLKVLPEADLFAARLDPFDPSTVAGYPVFKKPEEVMVPGRSLCKIGFSYAELSTVFEPENEKFSLDFQSMVLCPIDGILTRNIIFKTPDDSSTQVKFIETATPGLRGHAGAPVLDVEGRVCGLHSRTAELPIDDSNSGLQQESKSTGIAEERTVPVSWAIHPDVLTQFFKDNDIAYDSE